MAEEKRLEISICMGSSCFARGNNRSLSLLQEHLKARGLEGEVKLKGVLCCGGCSHGPNLVIAEQTHERVESGSLGQLLDRYLPGPEGGGRR